MKRIASMPRRILAITGSAVVGLVGAVALASPASAHHSEVSGTPYCDTKTGEWVVTWTVNSIAPRGVPAFKLVEVVLNPPGSTVTNIAATEGEDFPHPTGQALVGEQRLPGDASSASLAVRAMWSNGYEEKNLVRSGLRFDGECEQEKQPGPVTVGHAADCEQLIVTVDNPEDGATTEVTITTSDGAEEVKGLAAGEQWSTSFPGTEGLTYQVTAGGETIAEGGWEDPGDCESEVEVPIAWLPDCDSLTVEVTNPLEDVAIEATLSSGEQTETLTVEPGATAEASFDADTGTVVTVTIGDESHEITWEQPEDCDGAGGGLPETGVPTGLVVGAALALLALGGGLFLVARRRRITFTA